MTFKNCFSPLKKATAKYKIIAFDTEDNATGCKDNLICACFYSDDEQKTFFNRDEARKYLLKQHNKPTIYFAHNLSYDLLNLDYPENSIKLMPLKSRLIGGSVQHGKNKVRFMDTANFFIGATIESLGEVLGYPKIQFDLYNKTNKIPINKISDEVKKELSIYCMRDAEICYKAAMKLQELATKNNTRFKAYTAASFAMKIFRTNFFNDKWYKRPSIINDLERLSYYGGRTEVFNYRLFKKVIYEDIVSSYPTSMYYKNYPHPNKYVILKNRNWDDIRNEFGVSLCRVNVPYLHIPPLPVRRIVDGRLIFPTGSWVGVYTHAELVMAEKYGVKIEPVESIIYEKPKTDYQPFKQYIDFFFKLKQNSVGLEREFNKLMMNGLSGKFGESRSSVIRGKMEEFQVCNCNILSNETICSRCNKIILNDEIDIEEPDQNGWISLLGGKLPDPIHTFPIMISYITSYSRIKLYEERLSKNNPIYCDTDSSVSEQNIQNNIGKDLGNWEQKTLSNFIAYAPKYYRFDELDKYKNDMKEKIKLKGIPKKHIINYECHLCNEYNTSTICKCGNILSDNDKIYKYSKPIKLAEAIKRKILPNTWIEYIKKISLIDSKRIKNSDGTSKPHTFNDQNNYYSFNDYLNELKSHKKYVPTPEFDFAKESLL